MKKQLLLLSLCWAAATGVHAADGIMIPADQMVWKELNPGGPVLMSPLWGDHDTGDYAMLLKFPAGVSVPVHAHTGDYYGIVLKGNWRHSFDGGEEKDLPPGSYIYQPGMGFHSDGCVGSEDCILLIRQSVKFDFIAKEVSSNQGHAD